VANASLSALMGGLFVLLVVASTSKFLQPSTFTDALDGTGFPVGVSRALSVAVPASEAGLAVGLAVARGPLLLVVLSGVSLLMLSFAAWVAFMLYVRRDRVACGCFGSARHPISGGTFVRNVMLILISSGALLLASAGTAQPPGNGPFLLLSGLGIASGLALATALRGARPAMILTMKDLVRAEEGHR
jgi:Methylamine utilisation protein MauE